MRRSIVITGQIRDEQVLAASLEQYRQLKQEGMIESVYLSTWLGQIPSNSALRHLLSECGCTLLESPEPSKFSSQGHFFHQVKSASLVLHRLPDNQRVIKTRADVLFEDVEDIRRLLTCDLSLQTVEKCFSPFSGRIWVPFFDASLPFLISDVVIAGAAGDLRAIFAADVELELLQPGYLMDGQQHQGVPHQPGPEFRLFVRPFERIFPVLRTFLQIYTYHIFRPTLRQYNLSSDWYAMYMGLYYFLLTTCFIIGRDIVSGRVFHISHLDRERQLALGPAPSFVLPRCTVDFDQFFSSWMSHEANHAYCDSGQGILAVLNGSALEISEPVARLHRGLIRALLYQSSEQEEYFQYRSGLLRVLSQNS